MKQAASTTLWMGSVEHKDNNELSYAERSSKKYNMESKRGQSIHLILIFLKKKRKKKKRLGGLPKQEITSLEI